MNRGRRETIASCAGIALSVILSAFFGNVFANWAEGVSTIHGDIHPFADFMGFVVYLALFFMLPKRRTLYTQVTWRAIWTAFCFASSGWSSTAAVSRAVARHDWLVVGYQGIWVLLSIPATLWMIRKIRMSILIRVRLHRAARRRYDLEQHLFQGAPYVVGGRVLGHEEIKAIEP